MAPGDMNKSRSRLLVEKPRFPVTMEISSEWWGVYYYYYYSYFYYYYYYYYLLQEPMLTIIELKKTFIKKINS